MHKDIVLYFLFTPYPLPRPAVPTSAASTTLLTPVTLRSASDDGLWSRVKSTSSLRLSRLRGRFRIKCDTTNVRYSSGEEDQSMTSE